MPSSATAMSTTNGPQSGLPLGNDNRTARRVVPESQTEAIRGAT